VDSSRSSIRVVSVALIASVVLGCGDAGDVRELPDGAEGAQRSALLDQEVVKEMRSPDTIGRIIYEPPADLSLASAQLRRPDLVKPDTTRRGRATGPTPRRDTTGGDATADTSGGAARPQPRPRTP
jgi:hypothetical protein